jgi:hypothetical protein
MPDIIVLDPTLGYSRKKYEYREAIRSFYRKDDEGESKKVVKASWGIYPRRSKEKLESGDFMDEDQKEKLEKGFITLRPTKKCLDELRSSLEDLIFNQIEYYDPRK